MSVHLVDVKARLIIESDVDEEELAGNLCARIEEYLRSNEKIIDIEIENTLLPLDDDDGSRDSGSRADPQACK
jgi:hypothetical protein